MVNELEAVVEAFALEPDGDGDAYTGRLGEVRVTACGTGIGPELADQVTARVLDGLATGVVPDHVMVVGICGGLDPWLEVGTFVNPEVVVDQRDGRAYVHRPPGDRARSGKLLTTPTLITDLDIVQGWRDEGFVAVDMETAAVAALCERAGVPWSAYRCISDRPSDGLIDDVILEMTRPDGSADLDVLRRRLDEDPGLSDRLERLYHDSTLATRVAAAAAVTACGHLAG